QRLRPASPPLWGGSRQFLISLVPFHGGVASSKGDPPQRTQWTQKNQMKDVALRVLGVLGGEIRALIRRGRTRQRHRASASGPCPSRRERLEVPRPIARGQPRDRSRG